jgi:zinc transport system ATP-binding protein
MTQSNTTTEPIVKLENVSFAYRQEDILKDVSLHVAPGEFVGIIGPNGGGKTTLLKLILGFIKPSIGKVQVFGASPQSALAQIAYVPQNLRFDRQFPISVMELVLSGRLSKLPWHGFFHPKDKEAAALALKKVGLLSFADASFGTLSGGQAQRALIARALVSEPNLLLLDEPTASVDAQAQAEIHQILQSLRGSMTILMVTHDLNAAVNLVQSMLCVQRTVFSLPPQKMCEHFAMGLYPPQSTDGKKR